MKKLSCFIVIVSALLITSCAQNKQQPDTGGAKDMSDTTESDTAASSATFTINNKTFKCYDVGALGDNKNNTLVITATSGADEESVYFSFTLKEIGKGSKKFNTTGHLIEFNANEEAYTNTYTADCTDKNTFSEGTITITSLIDFSNGTEGSVEGNFEGQLAIKRTVPSYPCGNGNSSTSKIELVNIKGSFKGAYINTKNVPG